MTRSTQSIEPPARTLTPCCRPRACVEDRRYRTRAGAPAYDFGGLDRLWDVTLLDRLQNPLTRYHD